MDLAATAKAAAEAIATASLDGRASAIGGSFFDPLPAGADAYVLSDILHNWDDARAGEILAGCARAADRNGCVLVIEQLREQKADTAIDLFMLMCFGGRERTSAELSTLAASCGLQWRSTTQAADYRTFLEFVVVR